MPHTVNPDRQVWIAMVNDEPIGKIQLFTIGNEIYISGFCLVPAYRGQGYGSPILTQTVETLASNGHKNITLEVATNNQNALSLYKNSGFEVTTAYDYYRLPV